MICLASSSYLQADETIKKSHLKEFETIQRNIEKYHPSHWQEYQLVSDQTLKQDALILMSDRTPVDVIIRRAMSLGQKLGLDKECK